MAVLRLLTVTLFAGFACSAPQATRIVGGYPTTVQEFPSIVQVEFLDTWNSIFWTQSCAATILNSRHVLSAAHCFDGPHYHASLRRIRAGATFRNIEGQVSGVWMEVNHPNYKEGQSWGFDADISVVRITIPLQLNPVIQPASIVAHGFMMPDDFAVVLVGWGASSEWSPLSPHLQQTTIYSVNHEECARRYLNSTWPAVITENMICAGILNVGGKGACEGDAGGPMYFQGVLVGVISWSNGCAKPEFPVVSTAVSPYTPWIVQTVSET